MITSVARTSWLNLRRDRAAMILSFVVPLVFFSIFASIFGGQRDGTSKVRVAVADEDRSPESKKLIDALAREPSLDVRRGPDSKQPALRFDAKSVEEYVRKGSAPAALVIPKGHGRFRILADSSDPVASNVISGMLHKVLMPAAPMAGIDVVDVLGKSKKNPIVAFYAAGIGVMFLLFTASNAGGALLEEAESGTLDRILSTRVTFTQLLLGKGLYLWTLAVTQLTVMFLWGALAFGLELRSHLAGFVLMTAATAVATSAFGLLLAALANTRQQLGAISTLVVLSVSALGGSMFPRFLMPEGLQKVGLVLFNAWAIEGFTRVFWREEPISSLAVPIAVLLAFGAAFFMIARRLARRWEVA